LTGAKLDFLIRMNELADYACRGDKFLPDEICNFLVSEFDLNAALILTVSENKSLQVIGRSAGVRKNIQHGTIFDCSVCTCLLQNIDISLTSLSNCAIQISEFVTNEACSLLPIDSNGKLLIKLAPKSSFTQNTKEMIEKNFQFISFIISIWHQKIGGVVSTSNGSLSQIFADSTQELKSGCNSIISYTTILSNESLSSSQKEYVTTIKRTSQNLLLQLNDLNEISKIEAGSVSKTTKKVELAKLITEIIELFRSRLNRKISFTVKIEKDISLPIELDEQKLKYILTTLIFISTTMTGQGEINLKMAGVQGNKIRFTIEDSGTSLKEEIVSKLFEPYSLSSQDEFKNSSLTGLSLTLVKKYINYLGGDISVSSLSGKGNSFTFTISGEMMSVIESSISQLPKPSSKNKVLVIEDDYATSKLLSNYLNKWGYDPTIVSTENQAFSLIDKEEMLAIILDIEMPNTNGLELLKKIHEHPNTKNTPVIVCSVEPEQQKAFMMGAVEYFIKPINYNFLVEVLTNYKLRKNSKILCVDDDLPTLNLVKQAIESVGFIAVAENVSANVMDVIKDKDIDLAIVDLDMPTPNGFELIKLIKSEKKFANLPIIIYTGKENYREDLSKIEGLFEELLEKRSTNIEDLADTISAMINRYETPPPVDEVIHKHDVIKILLAEDYKHSQIIVTRLLKKNNFENVVVVENGEDAVRMAQEEKFSLILMDMQMPFMNGFEATEKIREMPDYKNVPIIALTAFAMKGDREKCLEAGATDYIPKPIDSKEFIEKVKYYTNTLA
jgi:CheY-like chemotaxis protein/signal transduction histidine kinase